MGYKGEEGAYYSFCFEYCLYPSFLNLEELTEDGRVLLATGRDHIPCRERTERLRFTDKQARQRVYTEVYDFNRSKGGLLETEVLPDPVYLERRVAPFSNTILPAEKAVYDYDMTVTPPPAEKWRKAAPSIIISPV